VNSNWSVFDLHHYGFVYVSAAILAVLPLIAFAMLNWKTWRHSHAERNERHSRVRAEAEPVRARLGSR
jgi:predicted anti-sigma-YlaC factor YlaD